VDLKIESTEVIFYWTIHMKINVLYCHYPYLLAETDWLKLMQKIPDFLHAPILRYINWSDRQNALFSRLLLKHALIQNGFSIELLKKYPIKPHQRPELSPLFDINLSHSKHAAICAISSLTRIGIDLEYHRFLDINSFQRIFSPKQWQALQDYQQHHDPQQALHLFYQFWTLKESVAKADGRGLGIDLSAIEEHSKGQVNLNHCDWWVQALDLNLPNYSCYLASEKMAIVEIKELTLNDFLF
jgi:4'-phosphopantetheinyl transferase